MDLYVASWEQRGGKTTLCAGIGRSLQKSGVKVGYLTLAHEGAEQDARFMKLALGLEGSLEVLSPHSAGGKSPDSATTGIDAKFKQARDTVAANKDLVLIEGPGGLSQDRNAMEAAVQTVQALAARVIVVINYETTLQLDLLAEYLKKFGQNLLGVVINRIPQNKTETARAEMTSVLDREGVRALCLLTEDRSLFGLTMGELAEQLQAEVACCPEALETMVHNVMIGVMTPDSGTDYFVRKDHKAVLARGERPDMHLAALGTPTGGLILTGGTGPIPQVKAWAEEKHVPILVTKVDTLAAASEVEKAFVSARFHQQAKLAKLEGILEKAFDFPSLRTGLGLAG